MGDLVLTQESYSKYDLLLFPCLLLTCSAMMAVQILKQFKKKIQNNSQTYRILTAKAVNKLFCSSLDSTTVQLFHSQPGCSQLWPGCYY